MVTIPELMIEIVVVSIGIVNALLFMKTFTKRPHVESTKYLLILEAWSAIVLSLVGLHILPLLNVTIVLISLGALMLAASFLIYDNQKVNYAIIKA